MRRNRALLLPNETVLCRIVDFPKFTFPLPSVNKLQWLLSLLLLTSPPLLVSQRVLDRRREFSERVRLAMLVVRQGPTSLQKRQGL